MSFLITGAAGFIGSRLAVRLAGLHGVEQVTGLVPPVLDGRETERVCELEKLGIKILRCDLLKLSSQAPQPPGFRVLYHLAGYAITEDALGPFEVNSVGTRLLLEWLGPVLRGKRVIYTGTLASVDARNREGSVEEKTKCNPVTVYGKTKLEGERWIERKSSILGYNYSILRLCTIIGAGHRPGGMFGVFPEMLRRNALGTRLNWPGEASFLDVEDLVSILVRLPELEGNSNSIYVTGTEEAPSFDELLSMIAEVIGVQRKRIILPGLLWKTIFRLAWIGATLPGIGTAARTFFWRLCHLCGNGLRADATRINTRTGLKLMSVKESLRLTYEQSGRKGAEQERGPRGK